MRYLIGNVASIIEKRGFQFFKMTAGSALFASFKLIVVVFNERHAIVPMWLCYLFVLVVLNFAGWIYHTKVTFTKELSVDSFKKYIIQSVGFKIFDYGLFNFLVYIFSFAGYLAVIINIAIIYVLRMIVYVKYVYR